MSTSRVSEPSDLAEQVNDLEHRADDVVTLTEAVQRHLRQAETLLQLCQMILLKQDGKDPA